jgi:VanZ family protein
MNSSFIKALIWAILILIGSSLSGDTLSEVKFINIPGFDKFVHVTWYFVLFLFLAAGVYKKRQSIQINQILLLLLACVVYGGLLEFLQGNIFVKRSEDVFDFIANSSGVIIASLLFSYLYKRKFWKRWL